MSLNYNQIQVRIAELERNAKVLQYITLKNALSNKAQEMRKLALRWVDLDTSKSRLIMLDDGPDKITSIQWGKDRCIEGVIKVPRGSSSRREFTVSYRNPAAAGAVFRVGGKITL